MSDSFMSHCFISFGSKTGGSMRLSTSDAHFSCDFSCAPSTSNRFGCGRLCNHHLTPSVAPVELNNMVGHGFLVVPNAQQSPIHIQLTSYKTTWTPSVGTTLLGLLSSIQTTPPIFFKDKQTDWYQLPLGAHSNHS